MLSRQARRGLSVRYRYSVLLSYPATFEPDEIGRPVVSFPDLPNVHTDGRDMQEAMEEAIDCLGSHLAECMATSLDIPSPSEPLSGQQMVPVPLWIAGKLALYTALRDRNMSTGQLAQLLGVRESVVRQMLDPDHDTRSERLQAALQRLGQ